MRRRRFTDLSLSVRYVYCGAKINDGEIIGSKLRWSILSVARVLHVSESRRRRVHGRTAAAYCLYVSDRYCKWTREEESTGESRPHHADGGGDAIGARRTIGGRAPGPTME